MNRRHTRSKAFAPDPAAPGRPCDASGCDCPGEYRAPKSRDSLNLYWWFCLEHVRAYNAKWDFYKGMSPGQIEAQLRADASWQRPSWPLGRNGVRPLEDESVYDPMELLAERRSRRAPPPRHKPPAELRDPLVTFGLDWPVTLEDVKTRYKELAKRHHPDANGGSRAAEEHLKTINLAYATLRRGLETNPVASTG